MQAKLRIVGGEDRGREIPLQLPTTVGRGASNTITLSQPLVSRHHCEVLERDGRLWVRDTGSLNGTFVGSQRIDGIQLLSPGQLLTVGTVTFRALYGEIAETDASGFMSDSIGIQDMDTIDIASGETMIDPLTHPETAPAEVSPSLPATRPVDQLIARALESGGHDNVTVQVIAAPNSGNAETAELDSITEDKQRNYLLYGLLCAALLLLLLSIL